MTTTIETTVEHARRTEAATRLGAVLPYQPTPADVEAAVARLHDVQRRGAARTVSEADLRGLVEVYRRALALAAEYGWDLHSVAVTTHGGWTTNSYSYRADTTYAHIEATRPLHVPGAAVAIVTGPGGIRVERGRASSRPYGNGWTWKVQIRVGADERRRPECWGTAPRIGDSVLAWRW